MKKLSLFFLTAALCASAPSWAAEEMSFLDKKFLEIEAKILDSEIKRRKEPQPPMCLDDGTLDEDKGNKPYFWWGNYLENIGHRLKEKAFRKAKPSLPTFDQQPELQKAYWYYQAAAYAYEMSEHQFLSPSERIDSSTLSSALARASYTRDAIERCSKMTESDT